MNPSQAASEWALRSGLSGIPAQPSCSATFDDAVLEAVYKPLPAWCGLVAQALIAAPAAAMAACAMLLVINIALAPASSPSNQSYRASSPLGAGAEINFDQLMRDIDHNRAVNSLGVVARLPAEPAAATPFPHEISVPTRTWRRAGAFAAPPLIG